jgi:DNA-directed RNA polymerase subunit RPC12/RpoP
MNHAALSCPDCGNKIIDTRETVQPYNDFDNYCGFRCSKCKRTFTDSEVNDISRKQHGSNS